MQIILVWAIEEFLAMRCVVISDRNYNYNILKLFHKIRLRVLTGTCLCCLC